MSVPAPIAQLQDTISGWFRDRAADRPEPTRQDLPAEAERSLKNAIAELPPHPTHCKAVAEAIVKSLAAQPDESEERNALVVLSTPAESLVPILQVALQQPELADLPVVTLDSFASRAIQPAAVLTELRQAIDTLPVPASLPRPDAQAETVKVADPDGSAIAPREIAAIPALSECFVRCIEGMNGIEALWTTLSRDTSRFWVVGCNQWAWNYLERTTRIS
ncbi:MAG: hypothetical protein AAFX40_09525, partial [Cyanobacteria bacterium J06639_1]